MWTDSSTGIAAVTIRDVVDWFIYGALIAGGVVLALATARLVTQLLKTWRDFKRLRRRLVRELDRVADRRGGGGGEDRGDRDAHASSRAEPRPAQPLDRAAPGADRRDRRGGRDVRARRVVLPAQVRVAAVDLGTNTTRLLVADVGDGRVEQRAAPGVADHAARRGRRRAPPPPPRSGRARAQRARGLPADPRVARAPSGRWRSRRAPCARPRTARRSSARSSGATASRRVC